MALRPIAQRVSNPAANLAGIDVGANLPTVASPTQSIANAVNTNEQFERIREKDEIRRVLAEDTESILEGDMDAFNRLASLPGGIDAAKNVIELGKTRDENVLSNVTNTLKKNKVFNASALKETNLDSLRKRVRAEAQARLALGDMDGAEELMNISQLPTIDDIHGELASDLAIANAGLDAINSLKVTDKPFQKTRTFLIEDKDGNTKIITGVFNPNDGSITTSEGTFEGTVLSVEGETPEEKAQREIDTARRKKEAEVLGTAKGKEQTTEGKQAQEDRAAQRQNQLAEAQGNLELVNSLAQAELGLIFGRGESLIPQAARSQEGQDLLAQVTKLTAQLELAEAGKLKGQGPISQGERDLLASAVAVLKNQDISPELALAEIEKVRPTFQRIIDRINGGQADADDVEVEIDVEEFKKLPRQEQLRIIREQREKAGS